MVLCSCVSGYYFSNLYISTGVKEEQIYQEAMKDDIALSILYLKLIALGPAQVGKSTFLRRLLGLMKWDINTASIETQPGCSTGQVEMRDVHLEQATDKSAETSESTDDKTVNAPIKEYASQTVAVTTATTWQTFKSDSEQTTSEAHSDLKKELAALTCLITSEELQTERKAKTTEKVKPEAPPTRKGKGVARQTPELKPDAHIPREELKPLKVAKDTNVAAGTHQQVNNPDTSPHFSENETPKDRLSVGSTPTPETETTDVDSEEIDKLFDEFEKIRLKAKTNPELGQKLVRIIINAADVGGQPAFLDMLTPLTIGPAMYLLLMKSWYKFRDRYTVMFKSEGDKEASCCQNYTFTPEEVFYSALSSIACFGLADEEIEKYICPEDKTKEVTSKHDSVTLILGTFADEVKGNEERQAAFDEMEKLLKEQIPCFGKGLVECYDDSRVMFPVNNKSGGEEEVLWYRETLEKIMTNRLKKYNIPARWFMLSVFLRWITRERGKCTVSIKECLEIGRKLGIKEREKVEAALKFLHKYIGLVMYFPTIDDDYLKDRVICNPQVIFSSISELIFKVYTPEKIKSERIISSEEYNRFINTGMFSPEAMKMVTRDDLIPLLSLMKLLVYFSVAAPVPRLLQASAEEKLDLPTPASSSLSTCTDYFLPAILPTAPEEELELPTRGDNVEELPEPLMVRFKTGYVPLGFFCSLEANLVSANHDGSSDLVLLYPKPEQGENDAYVVRKNKITFRARGKFDVTLISRAKYCEFRICRAPGASAEDDFSDHCPAIRQTLFKAVDRVISGFHKNKLFMPKLVYSLGFRCRTSNHSSILPGHEPLALSDSDLYDPTADVVPEELSCSDCNVSTSKLSKGMKVWYGEVG